MADEEDVQYYWDEDTQTYYYWDEETQAYYPWVEPAAEEAPNMGPSEPQEPLECHVSGVADVDPALSEELEPFPVQQPVVEDLTVPQPPPAVPSRSMRRRFSFAEHGGLAGCIQLANAERLQRQDTVSAKLTDEEIKLEQQKARVRDLLQEKGLIEGSGPSLDNTSSDRPRDRSASCGVSHTQGGIQGMPSSAAEAREVFVNTRRGDLGRRSSVRFGTAQFNDPNFQERLEAMLGSQVKKPTR